MTIPDTIPIRADRVVALAAHMDKICAELLTVFTVNEVANALTDACRRVVNSEHMKRLSSKEKMCRT